jgi:predicted dienelactone hydrolase
MSYDPFARGAFPVGVRTFYWTDPARGNRPLTMEIWYPASDSYRGQDTDAATRDSYELIPGLPGGWQDAVRDAEPRQATCPLVVFSHGFGGHRRQSTFLCTHLASHGYVVAAMDHTGNTIFEMFQYILEAQMGAAPPDPATILGDIIPARPADASFVIDRMLAGVEGVPPADPQRIGMSGHSFGGWTTLMVAARDRRVRAALPLAPAGGWTVLPSEPLQAALDFAWNRDVPTLFLVAESDTILPLKGMYELFERTQATKRMLVLTNADHMHFCDQIEVIHELFRMMPPPIFDQVSGGIRPIDELCRPEHAYDFVRGLALAHMDAYVRGHAPAATLLEGDLPLLLRARGVDAVRV